MKHVISNPRCYFSELDNYEYVTDILISYARWSITYGNDNISFDTKFDNTFLVTTDDLYQLQEHIDTKNIIVCGEQTDDLLSLYPVISITKGNEVHGNYVMKLKIFHNEDMLQTILKLKLSH